MSGKTVRLADVAAASGVAVSTVSKVLNGEGRVSAETRSRVLATAERLDYRPNVLARSFVTGRSFTVGILAEHAAKTFSMPVVIGANAAFSDADLATLMYDAVDDRSKRREFLRRMRARHVDGVLVAGQGPDIDYPLVSSDIGAPVVYVFSPPRGPQEISYSVDNHMIGRLAGQHLIDIGRRRIAHVAAGRGLRTTIEREAGLTEALHESGLELAGGAPLYGTFDRRWGTDAAKHLLESGVEFDAVFAATDELAVGVYAALRASGARIPDDIALAGVDNFSKIPGKGDTFLTTIDPRLPALGAAAADHLRREITEGGTERGEFLIPSELIIGRTTVSDARDPDPYSDEFFDAVMRK